MNVEALAKKLSYTLYSTKLRKILRTPREVLLNELLILKTPLITYMQLNLGTFFKNIQQSMFIPYQQPMYKLSLIDYIFSNAPYYTLFVPQILH